MKEPTWFEVASLTDQAIAELWVEWDRRCQELMGGEHGWAAYDQASRIRDQVLRYAGQRLVNREVSKLR